MQIESMEACTKMITEATKGIGSRYIKGATKDCFIFDSLLFSKKSEEYAIEVGAEIIDMVKINTKGFLN